MLQLYNFYIDIFMTAKEHLTINENISLHLKIVDVRHFDHHRYNHLIASEVIIIMSEIDEKQVKYNFMYLIALSFSQSLKSFNS